MSKLMLPSRVSTCTQYPRREVGQEKTVQMSQQRQQSGFVVAQGSRCQTELMLILRDLGVGFSNKRGVESDLKFSRNERKEIPSVFHPKRFELS